MKFSNQIFWALNNNVPDIYAINIQEIYIKYIYLYLYRPIKIETAIFGHHNLVLLVENTSGVLVRLVGDVAFLLLCYEHSDRSSVMEHRASFGG